MSYRDIYQVKFPIPQMDRDLNLVRFKAIFKIFEETHNDVIHNVNQVLIDLQRLDDAREAFKTEADSRFLRVEGQNGMEADLTMGDYKITNLAEPTQDDDGTTKKYVDAELATKSNIGHVHTESDITDLDKYSQSEANALLDTKLDVDVYSAFIENFDLDGDM